MYNKMGDSISMQYGGSIAHHAQMGKKKRFGLNEVWTSIIRHYNNVYIDPDRQRVINLFLGIYKPLFFTVPIWNITDEENHKGNYKRVVKLNHIQGTKWWVPYVEEFENDLPTKFKRSQTEIITRNPDSDSDDGLIDEFIEQQITLFTDKKYIRMRNGLLKDEESRRFHPLHETRLLKKKKKTKERLSLNMINSVHFDVLQSTEIDSIRDLHRSSRKIIKPKSVPAHQFFARHLTVTDQEETAAKSRIL